MKNRSSARTHPECRALSRRCSVCADTIERPAKIHKECRDTASREARERAAGVARRCSRCKQIKPFDAFSNDSNRHDGKFPYCMACQHASNQAGKWQDISAEPNGHLCPLCEIPIRGHRNRRFCSHTCKERVRSLKRKFGLTVQQYRSLIDASGGVCPICRFEPDNWQVDHDHVTGRVSGVVCRRCNVQVLAASRHNVELAERLVAYLKSTPASQLGCDVIVPERSDEGRSQIHKMWAYQSIDDSAL